MTTARLADAAWLREGPLPRVMAALDGNGEETRVVGGAVRNALLAEPIGDIDLATTAVPDEVIRRAAAAGFRTVPTGIDHGTVTVIVNGRPFEVTTLRRDVETFGRHATVAFGRDWKTDAERRDFTMNALSATADGTVHDYVGGLADLGARRVRFIGDAAKRIAEDYLRILRFFRFHAAYGEGPPDLRKWEEPCPRTRNTCTVGTLWKRLDDARRGFVASPRLRLALLAPRVHAPLAGVGLVSLLSNVGRS